MKILGLDVGEKRIGVARVDSTTKIALPVGFIEVNGNEWQELNHLANIHNTKFFVIGLPRSNEGNETKQSLYARQFAKTLTEKVQGAKIRFQDESLTSVEAENRLKSRQKKYERGDIDAEAASIILQDFVETYKESDDTKEEPFPGIIENNAKKVAQKAHLNSKKAIESSKKIVKKTRKNLIITPIIIVAVLAAICGGIVFWYLNSLSPVVKNCDENRCPDVEFTILPGDSVDTIANNLEEAKLIKSPFFFKINLKLSFNDAALKSGRYVLNQGMSASDIAKILSEGAAGADVFSFTILPGETIFDIKKNLIKLGYRAEEIDTALHAEYNIPVLSSKPAEASLEGYLFGETYEFFNDASVKDIFETFLMGTNKVVEENDLINRFATQGLNLHEGITLASVVQKESKTADQPTVAQVFLKRLSLGIPLGSDVTVTYALDVINPDRNRDDIAVGDALLVQSCYNTRQNAGLPCGPISNPGLSAMTAVADPSDTDYLYFLTGDDGKMYYSYTEAEHNQNARDHCQVLCNVSLWKRR